MQIINMRYDYTAYVTIKVTAIYGCAVFSPTITLKIYFYFYYNDCVQFLLHRSFFLLFVMTRSEVTNEIKICLNLTYLWLSLFNRKPKSIIFLDLIRLPHVQPHITKIFLSFLQLPDSHHRNPCA